MGLWLLADGLKSIGVTATAPEHNFLWNLLGYLKLSAGVYLLIATAHVWLMLLGGAMVLAVVKCLIMLVTGRNFYTPHDAFPRASTVELLLFAIATIVFLVRFAWTRPIIVDRLALTFYLFAVAWSRSLNALSILNPRPIFGLIALALAWAVDYWRNRGQKQGYGDYDSLQPGQFASFLPKL